MHRRLRSLYSAVAAVRERTAPQIEGRRNIDSDLPAHAIGHAAQIMKARNDAGGCLRFGSLSPCLAVGSDIGHVDTSFPPYIASPAAAVPAFTLA